MFREHSLPRNFLVYAICLPIALLTGYLLATPFIFTSYATIGLILVALAFPVMLRWHHPILIFTWNAYLIVFFLPGEPMLGYVMATVSLGIVLLNRAMGKEAEAVHVRSVSWSLIFLALVVIVTAKLTGGIGGRALGAESWGGKRYLGVFCAVIGYFAMTSQSIPEKRRLLYTSIFVLSGTTAVFSDLIYAAGPKFYSLFLLFPSVLAGSQAITEDTLLRLTGVGFAAQSANLFVLMRYGIRGVCDFTRPWRLIIFLGTFIISLFGGYRSLIILAVLLFLTQFWFERLYRGRHLVVLGAAVVLLGCGIFAFATKLPLSIQRSLSFLPVEVDPTARQNAQGTLDWRLLMWKVVVPEIPQYLWLGKGFAYSGTDSYLTTEAIRRGIYPLVEGALVAGDYHQGLLSILIPFGIWGMIGFAWFCWAALRVLHLNYRHSEEELKLVNAFLLSLFIARLIFYVFFYGQFELDLSVFVGLVAINISLNGGVAQRSKPRED